MPEDPRLTRLSALALALPEAERELSEPHATFRVRKRTFAYFLDNHRGDEDIVGLVCRAPLENRGMVDADPERFYLPSYLHHRNWIGLRLDTATVDWDEVESLVTDSYLAVAPKRLAAQLTQPPSSPSRSRER